MNESDLHMVPFLAVGIVICVLVARHVWFNTQTRGRHLFAIATFASCFWMLGDVIGRCTTSYNVKYFGEIVRYFGVVNVPVWMFAFTRAYCGKSMSRRTIKLLLIIPVISFVVMATSHWHHWFFKSMEPASYGLNTVFGPYFLFVHMPYCYLLTALSIAMVLSEMARVPSQYRPQIFILLVSLCVPVATNIGGMTGLLEGYYNTALSFPIFAIVLLIGIFRQGLLNVNPIAYESVFQNVRDGVIILSRDDRIVDINRVAARHTGKPVRQLIGTRLTETFGAWTELLAKLGDKKEISDEFSDTSEGPTGYYSVHTANFIGIDKEYDGRIVTLRDITANRQYQESLVTLAYFDSLTRLANRRRLQEEVEKAVQRSARREEWFALLYFDLNKFKTVNDTLGHEAGDELLKHVGAVTTSLLRAPDFVARLGGDEFVILLHNAKPQDERRIMARMLEHVQQPVEIHGQMLTPRLSLGAAFYPQDGENLQALLRHADKEMYRVKTLSGGMPAIES